MDEFKDPNFKFVVLEHIRRIAKISAHMGQRTAQSMDNYYTAVNGLEDLLITWIPTHASEEMAAYRKEIEDGREANPDISMEYPMVRKKYQILMKVITGLGWMVESEAVGK